MISYILFIFSCFRHKGKFFPYHSILARNVRLKELLFLIQGYGYINVLRAEEQNGNTSEICTAGSKSLEEQKEGGDVI